MIEDRAPRPEPSPPPPSLSGRDRAVLRAVAAGRCVFVDGTCLTVDSVRCCDQFVGARLADAGLITGIGAASLTAAGRDLLAAG